MTVFVKVAIGFILGAGAISNCFATDDTRQTEFFDSVAMGLREEYRECTGDNRPIDVRHIILWKQKMDAWAKTEEYAEIAHEYKRTKGSKILPCKLIEWSRQRKQAQDAKEAAVVNELLDSSEADEAAVELKALAVSRFDFLEIPFGLSKRSFMFFFKKRCALAIGEKGRFLYTEKLPVGGLPFLAAFHFNDAGIYYKYEIESDPLPADSLNRVVRLAADHLAHFFEQRLGPPTHSSQVGLFDIKSRELALYKKWETGANSLLLGFSVVD